MKSTTLHITSNTADASANIVGRSDLRTNIQALLPGYSTLAEIAQSGDILIFPSRMPTTPTRRLVVIVPQGEIDADALARRVWQFACRAGLHILYVMVEPNDLRIAYQRRRLSELASMTTSKEVRARANMSSEKSWSQALAKILYPGDLIICLANHKIPNHLLLRRALGEELAESRHVPVYLLGGLKIGLAPRQIEWIKDVQAWTASGFIVAIFLALQAVIVRSTIAPVSTILICLSLLVEIFSLWKINEWID
jgi:hypothetical protein